MAWKSIATCIALVLSCKGPGPLPAGDQQELDSTLPTPPLPTSGNETRTLNNYTDRPYVLYTPPGIVSAAGQEFPLVISLHGSGSNGFEQQQVSCEAPDAADASCFDRLADAEPFLVVYPNGTATGKACPYLTSYCDPRAWSPGAGGTSGTGTQTSSRQLKEIDYLDAVLQDVMTVRPVDRDRIYIIGMSNGAAMAFDYACKRRDAIAAVALIAGGGKTSNNASCKKDRRPTIQFHGTGDPIWQYKKMESNIGAIAKQSACKPTPSSSPLPDQDPSDGTTTTEHIYENCKDAPLVHYEVTGGGHTWPGGLQYGFSLVIGRVARDFAANKVIWNFFKDHPRTAAHSGSSPSSPTTPNACTSKAGETGLCISRTDCAAKGSGFAIESRRCPHDPNGILCCFEK